MISLVLSTRRRFALVAYRFSTASMETCCTLTVSGTADFITNPTRRSLASFAESFATRLPL